MANEKQLRVPMPEQEPQERIHNFDEVAKGYTLEQAMGRRRAASTAKTGRVRRAARLETGFQSSWR